ncbi:hypothetical protein LNJ03_12190 [Tenacibaculum dicentrarchi]|nr:hypothetical protein [Tenacibaculum dicentrarchi]
MDIKLDLRNNALNSIYQGLTHLERAVSEGYNIRSKDIEFDHEEQMVTYKRNGKLSFYLDDLYYIPPRYYEFKFSILQFIHGIELLLLDIVKSKNENEIFESTNRKKTINFWKALNKTKEIIPDLLTESQIKSLETCKELRNNLEHFEIQSNYNGLYKVTSQLLSIVNSIFQIYLNLNLVRFYEFDCWKDDFNGKFTFSINQTLQDLKKNGYDFNSKLIENKNDLSFCIYCNENSYSESENLCLFCLTEIDEEIKNVL